MDYLEKNIDWLEAKLKPLLKGFLVFRVTVLYLFSLNACLYVFLILLHLKYTE